MLKWISPFAAAFAAGIAAPAPAQDFDYYLLALSWSPSWCAAEGDAQGSDQCDPARDLGFILHGLWPQYQEGWPEFCTSAARDPSRRETAAMADIMGTGSLAWYQWQKHGRCTGLPARDYFDLARLAFGLVTAPELEGGRATADAVEAAFLDANRGLAPEDLIVTCGDGRVEEVRICLTRALDPRPCAADVAGDACRNRGALEVPPVR